MRALSGLSNTAEGRTGGGAPVVLPVTRRGIALTDRACWVILGIAMAASAALILYLNRGTTFYLDQLRWLYATPGLDVEGVLEPHNGHLIATTRLVYKAILETAGAGYLPFRLLGVSALLLAAGAFFAVAKRRIGALPALAPTLVLLFLGAAPQLVVIPIGFTDLSSIAAGLAALLALERGDRRGDAAACAFLVLSVASYSTGLAFVAGVGVAVLLGRDRWQRAWVFLVPALLYAAWWMWALSSPGTVTGDVQASNILLIPSYSADALAASIAALSGLAYDFGNASPDAVRVEWGSALAVAALAALALRIRRGRVPRSLWAAVGILLTYWALGALVTSGVFGRVPEGTRYVYLGVVGVLLVATDAARGARFTGVGLAALLAACAISLSTNIALLRDGAAGFRSPSAAIRADLAAVELARDRVEPGFDPLAGEPVSFFVPSSASAYLALADRHGSLAFSPSELQRQSEPVREGADRVLVDALRLHLTPADPEAATDRCRTVRANAGGRTVAVALSAGGAVLQARGPERAGVSLGRFAALASAKVGRIAPREPVELRIPADASSRPWHAAITGARSVEVCELG